MKCKTKFIDEIEITNITIGYTNGFLW